jgi:hypothetical protein
MRARVLFTIIVAAACGPSTPRDAPVLAETCRIQLGPRAPSTAPNEAPPPPPPPTRIIAHVELKLARLKTELEAKVPTRVAEERGQGIGVGGHLNYVADRGPFTIGVENDALVVRTDVRAHAEACRGSQCYASCDPIARATAVVPLQIGADWRFLPSRVTTAFTKGCEVRVLGGLVRVDVTPTIEGRLAPTLRRIEQQIDHELPPLRPQAERLWSELEKPRALPLGGCVIVDPQGIVQGPVSGTSDVARVRFGLLASPEIRTRCGATPASRPLPALARDPGLPAEDDIALALVGPLATAMSGLRDLSPFDAGGARARVADVRAPLADLRGEACGEIEVRSPLTWNADGVHLGLASPMLPASDEDRLRAASLDPKKITTALAGARLPPPIPIDGLKEVLPQLGSALADPTMDVTVKIASVTPLDAYARGEDVVARAKVRGSVELRER